LNRSQYDFGETLNLPPPPRDHPAGPLFAAGGFAVKVIRPEQKEAPLETQRPARTNPGMPDAIIRLALFALVLVIAGAAFLLLRG
jgi:hypothetical protein